MDKWLIKQLIFIVALLTGFIPVQLSAADDFKEPQVIASLQWGEVLFFHFSGDKMEALIRLYARESRNRLEPNQAQADLLAAGLLLDLGLALEAQKRLDAIGVDNLNIKLKSRLSIAMARVYFQGQDFNAAQHWLNLAEEQYLPTDELTSKKMMQAQIYFSTNQYDLAAKELENISNKGNLQYYALYNHGLSLLKFEDPSAQQRGRDLLLKISSMTPTGQEQFALIDQAKLALALNAINNGRPTEARTLLLNTRLDGLISNDALLLLGWSFAQTHQFEEALTYWKTLSLRNENLEPTVQESWLAVPYAYQELGDLKKAVEGYESALQQQLIAITQLDSMIENNWWRLVLTSDTSELGVNDSKSLVRQLIADASFYNLLENWKQLNALKVKLNSSLESLPIIAVVLEENELKYQSRSENINQMLVSNSAQNFENNYQSINEQFKQQKLKAVAEDILSPEDYGYWQQLQSAKNIIRNIPEEVGTEKIEKYRRLDGVAKWGFHRKHSANVFAVENSMEQLQRTISEMNNRLTRLKDLISNPRPQLLIDVQKVKQLVSKGKDVSEQLMSLQLELEEAMSTEFIRFANERKIALNDLAEQANLALARLRFKAISEELLNNE